MSSRRQRYGVLVAVYAVGLLFGIREFWLSRSTEAVAWPSEGWSSMTDVVARIAPNEPDTKWLLSQEALARGDAEEFARRLEEAIAAGTKDNEFLLQDYAQLMLDRRADYRLVNRAVNRWRENFPSSAQTLGLELGTGPRNPTEEAILDDALAGIPWVAGSWLESTVDALGRATWVVQLSFRPAVAVDLRDAIAAVTLLSLTDEQRSRFQLRCATLDECALEARAR